MSLSGPKLTREGSSRDTVSNKKLAYYLQSEVIGRIKKTGKGSAPKAKKKKAVVGEGVEGAEEGGVEGGGEQSVPVILQAVGGSTVAIAVAAMVALWTQQRDNCQNSHPHPRSGPVDQILKTLRRETSARRHATFEDRGIGKFHLNPGAEQLKKIEKESRKIGVNRKY